MYLPYQDLKQHIPDFLSVNCHILHVSILGFVFSCCNRSALKVEPNILHLVLDLYKFPLTVHFA